MGVPSDEVRSSPTFSRSEQVPASLSVVSQQPESYDLNYNGSALFEEAFANAATGQDESASQPVCSGQSG